MVKECIVKLNNDVVTVARYGKTDVQFPALRRSAKTIFVNYEDGKYSIVDKDHEPKCIMVKKKNTKKKTTNEELAKELEVAIEDNEDA